jgi:hypothetical protein
MASRHFTGDGVGCEQSKYSNEQLTTYVELTRLTASHFELQHSEPQREALKWVGHVVALSSSPTSGRSTFSENQALASSTRASAHPFKGQLILQAADAFNVDFDNIAMSQPRFPWHLARNPSWSSRHDHGTLSKGRPLTDMRYNLLHVEDHVV